MKNIVSREIHLVSRPEGVPVPSNFQTVDAALEPMSDEKVLVRNIYLSVDPYMRGLMNDKQTYSPPYPLNQAVSGGAVGEVVESHCREYNAGDLVVSNYGWREYFVATPHEVRPISREFQPLSIYLGALGMTGMTAWMALDLIEAKPGEVIYITGAAGAVGNVVGQLAKFRGCRVIGTSDSDEKVNFLRQDCGFDLALNDQVEPILDQFLRLVPGGIDVCIDNVNGEALEAALEIIRLRGRILICGGLSSYNFEEPHPGPKNLINLITKRLTVKGMFVGDWLEHQTEFEREMAGYFRSGKMKNRETVVEGIDTAVDAFIGLFHGENFGKTVVKLSY